MIQLEERIEASKVEKVEMTLIVVQPLAREVSSLINKMLSKVIIRRKSQVR